MSPADPQRVPNCAGIRLPALLTLVLLRTTTACGSDAKSHAQTEEKIGKTVAGPTGDDPDGGVTLEFPANSFITPTDGGASMTRAVQSSPGPCALYQKWTFTFERKLADSGTCDDATKHFTREVYIPDYNKTFEFIGDSPQPISYLNFNSATCVLTLPVSTQFDIASVGKRVLTGDLTMAFRGSTGSGQLSAAVVQIAPGSSCASSYDVTATVR